MSPTRTTTPPKLPTLPRGDQIVAFATYLEAQKAVEVLSDKGFAVEHVTIVGADLKMVERVTGRLTYSRVAAAGLASGAWFGLFVGLVLSLFSGEGAALPIFAAIGIGAGFGLLFSVLSFSMTRGKRDFTSTSQIVASSYALLCDAERAPEATRILRENDVHGLAPGTPLAMPAPAPTAPAAAVSHGTPSAGAPGAPGTREPLPEPRYGVRTSDGLPPRQPDDSPAGGA